MIWSARLYLGLCKWFHLQQHRGCWTPKLKFVFWCTLVLCVNCVFPRKTIQNTEILAVKRIYEKRWHWNIPLFRLLEAYVWVVIYGCLMAMWPCHQKKSLFHKKTRGSERYIQHGKNTCLSWIIPHGQEEFDKNSSTVSFVQLFTDKWQDRTRWPEMTCFF